MVDFFSGVSGANLYKLKNVKGEYFFLKTAIVISSSKSLKSEFQNYTWLKGKFLVPNVIFYEISNKIEYLCISKLKGKSLDAYLDIYEPVEIVTSFANTLKLLHSIKTDGKAKVQDIDSLLQLAKYNIDNNLVR